MLISEVMTPDPVCLTSSNTVTEAALAMRECDVGDVIVEDGSQIRGILTDRDIAVRLVADGLDASDVTVGEICSPSLTTISPSASIEDAVDMMHEQAVRRLPVVDGDHVVGIVSIGDLALERDPASALATISAAPPNV